METFSKAVGITIFIVVLFMFPMMYHAQKYDTVVQSYVTGVTNDFVEEVRSSGTLTQDMYSNFVADLNKSGNLYNIERFVISLVFILQPSAITIVPSVAVKFQHSFFSFKNRKGQAAKYRLPSSFFIA